MSDSSGLANRQNPNLENRHARHAWLLTVAVFGIFVVAQLAGIEVVGGDPDRFFRPLKSELVRSLKSGELPLWSDRFGFGMPLAAESEVGAFYPPHWFIYPIFDTSLGYRISQCVHQIMALGFLFLLARRLGAMPLGAALGAMIYVLGGFPTIQASKEWAILGMAWMPAAFLGTEIWFEHGWNRAGRRGLALLSASLACLALIGHFQMAQLTCLGLAIWVTTRSLVDRRLVRRWPGLILAVTLAAAIASPQLALSWKYAKSVGATDRNLATLSYYSYPVECLTELAIPLWTRRIAGGPEGAFWTLRNTTRYEAAMFVGTAGMMLAIIGVFARTDWAKRAMPLLGLISAGFLFSTMPQWSMVSYATVIELPGMGLFRCPGRYGVLAHLGLALAAARGWGRWPNAGSVVAILATNAGAAWFLRDFLRTPLVVPGIGAKLPVVESATILSGFTDPLIFGVALISFYLFALLIMLSVTRPKLRVLLFLAATFELTYFYFAGPTRWGWSLKLPESSQVLKSMTENAGRNPTMVAGKLDNIPVTAGLTTAAAYFGIRMPPANEMLRTKVEVILTNIFHNPGKGEVGPYARLGIRYSVLCLPLTWKPEQVSNAATFPADPLAEAVPKRAPGPQITYRIDHDLRTFPAAAWATTARETFWVRDGFAAFDQLYINPEFAAFEGSTVAQKRQADLYKLDTNASVTADEDRRVLKVTHSGTALVILRRTYDDGWHAIDEATGKECSILPVFGGIQAIVVPGDGGSGQVKETQVRLSYRPASLTYTIPASLVSVAGLIMLVTIGRNKSSSEIIC